METNDNPTALRARETEESIWHVLDTLAREVKPVDLGIGCPDFAAPRAVRQDLIDVVTGADTTFHQYTRGFGHPRLCRALSALFAPLLKRESLDPVTEVVVTNGATEALFNAFMGLLNPGDEVILFDPSFDCYAPQIKMAGGTPVFVPLKPLGVSQGRDKGVTSSAADWHFDKSELKAAFSSRTKAIVVNTPHNPLGKVFSRAELEVIAGLSRKFNVVVISDEVYEWLTFDGVEHVRIATLPNMWERTLTIGSAGKTFSVTGWRLGWTIGPAHLLAGPKVVLQNCGYICSTPLQEAVARSLERETEAMMAGSSSCYFTSLAAEASEKRDRVVALLSEAGLPPIVPQGGYFILADVRDLVAKIDVGGDTSDSMDFRFVKWLSKSKKLQGIPPSAFFSEELKPIGENYVRFCFIKDDRTLQEASDILRQLRESIL